MSNCRHSIDPPFLFSRPNYLSSLTLCDVVLPCLKKNQFDVKKWRRREIILSAFYDASRCKGTLINNLLALQGELQDYKRDYKDYKASVRMSAVNNLLGNGPEKFSK